MKFFNFLKLKIDNLSMDKARKHIIYSVIDCFFLGSLAVVYYEKENWVNFKNIFTLFIPFFIYFLITICIYFY
ncbi:hypothetical protein QOZ91_003823, partial [Clostridium sardiniense]|uniref:hypothetical protein n=1 Tax=Clostridium sardiniense TaxID=29369 RepID=UPI002785B174